MASRSASMKRLVNALGKLSWGTTACAVFVVCAATAITLPAQVSTLFTFDGTHGASPYAGLVQATDGDLYGTTWGGGAKNAGTVFKITPAGILTTLYSFCSQTNCTDGAEAEAGLFQAANGDLYGTTFYGGSHNHGTVFRITPTGTLTTLYSFCSQSGCADGDLPLARLVQAANRDLYGTTTSGGTHDGGTVFKITPSGTLTTLYSFCSQSACTDGLQPVAGLVQLANGDFYGTTQYGGGHPFRTGFKNTPSGPLTTLYRFVCSQSGCPDGVDPTRPGLAQPKTLSRRSPHWCPGEVAVAASKPVLLISQTCLETGARISEVPTNSAASQILGKLLSGIGLKPNTVHLPRAGNGFGFRVTHEQAFHLARDLGGGAGGIHAPASAAAVVRDHRAGGVVVSLQARQDDFLGVVLAANQWRLIGIADFANLGRLREHVVDASALAALAARGDARDQHLRGHVQMNGDGFGQVQFPHQAVEEGGLFQRARVAIQQEAGGAVRLPDSGGHDLVHDIVADQASGLQDGTGQAAQICAGLAFGAEHLAGGNGWDMEALGNRRCLCAFTAAGRSE